MVNKEKETENPITSIRSTYNVPYSKASLHACAVVLMNSLQSFKAGTGSISTRIRVRLSPDPGPSQPGSGSVLARIRVRLSPDPKLWNVCICRLVLTMNILQREYYIIPYKMILCMGSVSLGPYDISFSCHAHKYS